MKKILLTVSCFLATLCSVYGQLLYGVTREGGKDGVGFMFRFNALSGTYSKVMDFDAFPGKSLVQARDGRLYGMTTYGGSSDLGVIFSFDPSSSTYSKLVDFDNVNGAYPRGSLIQASDGNLYGMTSEGGNNNRGVIFSFDPSSFTYTKLKDFDNTNGSYPFGSLIQAKDGKLYGMTNQGGDGDGGIVFSFDPLALTYTKLVDFDYYNNMETDSNIGAYPFGHLIQATDGKLYGLTSLGGLHNGGTIFSIDPSSSAFKKLRDFGPDGHTPYGSLVQASNGKLYGVTNEGGLYAGTIFSFDPSTTIYTTLKDFSEGGSSACTLVEARDGKLYGTQSSNIFSFDPASSTYTNVKDFDGINGVDIFPGSALIEVRLSYVEIQSPTNDASYLAPANVPLAADALTSNGKIKSVDFYNGSTLLFTEYKYPYSRTWTNVPPGDYTITAVATDDTGRVITSAPVQIHVVTPAVTGFTLVNAITDKDVQFIAEGTILYNTGSLQKQNIRANTLPNTVGSVVFILDGETVRTENQAPYTLAGFDPPGDYQGWTLPPGQHTLTAIPYSQSDGNGPAGDSLTIHFTVITVPPPAHPKGLFAASYDGGSNDFGVLFSYDPLTSTYLKLHEFAGIDGAHAVGTLVQASDKKLYGMTHDGGNNGYGVIFSFDTSSSTFTKLMEFDSINGAHPYGSLLLAKDGKLYGMTNTGGSSNAGIIFSFEPSSSTFTKLKDFNSSGGKNPYGSLIQAIDGKLYGLALQTGIQPGGIIFSFDLPSSSYSTLAYTGSGKAYDAGHVYGSLMQARDGRLYGMTRDGGAGNRGALFSFNPSTSNFTKLVDFDYYNGSNPAGNSLMEASDGKLYGMTTGGGNDLYNLGERGIIFSFDPATYKYTKLKDFDKDAEGLNPMGNLVQAEDGNLYGMTSKGGNKNFGVAFSFNPGSSAYQKLLDFDGSNGANPSYGSAFASPFSLPVLTDLPPYVRITKPLDDKNFISPVTVLLEAEAIDPDGKIKSVAFYHADTLIFTEYNAPYSRKWTDVPGGNYSITAVATDDNGFQTTSAPVHIHVLADVRPSVNINVPADLSVFTAPAFVWLNAGATDPDGKVNSLELLNDTALIKKFDYSGKSSVTANALLRNLQHGNYTLSAKATDDYDSSASSSIQFSVVDDPSDTFLDSAFGTNGYVKTHLYAGNQFKDAAVQKDGKIVCVGSTNDRVWKFETPYADIVVARFNHDGSYDESFGGGLIVKDYFVYGEPWETSVDEANSVAIQADGKILVGGFTQYRGFTPQLVLIRYNTDGSQDNTFANNGEFVSGDFGPVNALAIQQDGKILVSTSDLIIRFNTDGTLDYSFGTNGRLTPDFNMTGVSNIIIQPDGKMLIANSNSVARYDMDGVLDQSFGTGGLVENGGRVALESSKRILVLNDSTLAAYLPDGNPDSSFGTDGIVQIGMGNSSLAIQADQKIIVGGWSGDSWGASHLDFAIARFQRNGSPDSAFGHSGKLVSNFDNTNQTVSRDYLNKLVTAKDRFYAVGGSDILDTLNFGFVQYTAVARYNVGSNKPPIITLNQPPNDTTYASPAKITFNAIASDADGTIQKVEFFNDTALLYSVYNYPYTFTWANVPDGNYSLIARAIDNLGLTSYSSPVKISVVPPWVSSFTLVDAHTGLDLHNFINPWWPGETNGSVLDIDTLPRDVNIRANTMPNTVGSVVFILDGKKVAADNDFPYSIGGDDPPGNYVDWTLPLGTHTLTAIPYSDQNAQGIPGTPLTIYFTAIGRRVESFTLMNAETDKSIKTIADYSIIDLATLPSTQLNIRANTNPKRVGSVVFILDGQKVRTENGTPYALAGDSPSGDYHSWTPTLGDHVLTAIPYADYNARGAMGVPLTIHFTVVSSQSNLITKTEKSNAPDEAVNFNLYPNPVTYMLTVTAEGIQSTRQSAVRILSISGAVIKGLRPNISGKSIRVDVSSLSSGTYLIQIINDKDVWYKRFEKL